MKIGKSSRPVDVRSKELDNTAVPLPFDIYATMQTAKYSEAEKTIHKQIDRLTNRRIRQNREFFNLEPALALEIMLDLAQLSEDAIVVKYEKGNPIQIYPCFNENKVKYEKKAQSKQMDIFPNEGEKTYLKKKDNLIVEHNSNTSEKLTEEAVALRTIFEPVDEDLLTEGNVYNMQFLEVLSVLREFTHNKRLKSYNLQVAMHEAGYQTHSIRMRRFNMQPRKLYTVRVVYSEQWIYDRLRNYLDDKQYI